jgi:hypothetical protein
MVLPLAAIAGGASAFSGVASALGGFFDNSQNEAIHRQNVARVAQIDAENQQKHFQNLTIGSRFKNRSAQLNENLLNIDTAASQARADTQSKIDSRIDQFMMNNQEKYIAMARGMSGGRSGRTNVKDRAAMAQFGRGQAVMNQQQRALQEQAISSGYARNRAIQNAKAKEKAAVGSQPIYQAYQKDYTPLSYRKKGFGDYLKLAGGLAGAAASGLSITQQLDPTGFQDWASGGTTMGKQLGG